MKDEAYTLMEQFEDTFWWYRARREIIVAAVRRFVPAGGRVIDFGCGTGSLAAALRQEGYRVLAADNDPRAIAGCRRRGLDVLDAAGGELPADRADAVLACDVLEHVADETGFLRQIGRLLAPTGCLLITVPAFEFLWSGEDHVSNHYRRYTRRGIDRALRADGFAPVWRSYFNTLLSPVAAASILYKRLFRPRDMYRSNVHPLPGWLNSLLYHLFAAERYLLPRFGLPFGVSLMAVSRPQRADPGTSLAARSTAASACARVTRKADEDGTGRAQIVTPPLRKIHCSNS